MSKTHLMSRTRPYVIWKAMKRRCYNKNDKAYKNYGGRNIKVCDRWMKFENFWEDMKNGYSDLLTLDRINNNGNYKKNNCRWATYIEQGLNKRNNIRYFFNGDYLTIREYSEKYGIGLKKLKARVGTMKLDIKQALEMGENKTKYYYYSAKKNGYLVEVTKNRGRIFGGIFKNKKDAEKKVKEILKRLF